jgi:hypothetical protein
VNPRIDHREFLRALQGLTVAYAILSRAIAGALPPQLGAVAAVDPLTRVTLEQFGDPLVRWFRRGSRLRGVHVADGTLVFDADADAKGGEVLFVPGLAAEHDRELPADWRERASVVAHLEQGKVVLP